MSMMKAGKNMAFSCGQKRQHEGKTFTICSSVTVRCGEETKIVCKNKLYEYDDNETWNDVLYDLLQDTDFNMHKTDTTSLQVSDKLMGTHVFEPDMSEQLRVVKEFDKTLKYATFTIERDKDVGFPPVSSDAPLASETKPSAFSVLMSSCIATKTPNFKENTEHLTAKDKIFNSLLQEWKDTGDGFPVSMSEKGMADQIQIIMNALWYISGNVETNAYKKMMLSRTLEFC